MTLGNPTKPTSVAEFNALTWEATTLDASITGAWSDKVYYESAELKTVFQKVVDGAGWAYKNNLCIGYLNNGGASDTTRQVESSGSNITYSPYVIITWEHPGIQVLQGISAPQDSYYTRNTGFSTGDFICGTWFGAGYTAGCRLLASSIPQGSEITSALLDWHVQENGYFNTNLTYTLYGNDVDDAARITNYTDLENATKTTAHVDKTYAGDLGIRGLDQSDVTSIIQEIVDRAGYAAGSDIGFVTGSGSGAGDPRYYYHGTQTVGVDPYEYIWLPRLYIEIPFTLTGAGGNKIMMVA
jgi:hypothetical protein